MGRGQSRNNRRATGKSDLAENTRIKEQIFRDALDAFEAQLAKPAVAAPAAKPIPPTSKERSSEHRATRAAIRKGLTATEDLLNTKAAKKKPARVKTTVVAAPSSPAPKKRVTATTKVPAALSAEAATAAKPRPVKAVAISPSKQRAATAAAKQSRVVRSGKTTRMFGHVNARGKRTQARRDTKR